ncbi:Odorant receptor 338 [Nylanderia fulva]|uniref:Odorant receptor n=1 Tax=Nylanderia fulva TaxID=613905 RepID=A0A6G1LP50_9HYME|nr:Odorant receptor 338 [Nylanderia fulva]
MDFAGERYYKLNRILLTVIGLWPYNDSTFNKFQRIFCILLFAFSICVQIGKIITSVSTLESLLQILSFVVPCLVFSLKYATFCIKSKIRKMMEQIKYHWNATKCKEELKILQRYSNIGHMIAIMVATLFYSCIYIFITMQIFPKILDVVAPLNESRPYELLAIATFFFDQEKYFVPIFVHMTVALSVEITTIVATETICLIYMQHACALFKIASFRIEHAFDCKIHITVAKKNMIYYTNIINAIIIHNQAIKFFEYLNSHFEISYFILLVLGVCSLSINLFRLFLAGFKNKMEELIAAGLLVFCHFIYMFISNFVAQRITNSSADIFYKTCELPWYSVSVQLQKLLQFIMQRSIKSCKFTMLSLFDASLERFASLVSVSLSYFTVFWSIRH